MSRPDYALSIISPLRLVRKASTASFSLTGAYYCTGTARG
jgi:hypothetical protein